MFVPEGLGLKESGSWVECFGGFGGSILTDRHLVLNTLYLF
nr:MAG TPA: hypothetical protein [Caudoviricetes sp.]